MSSKPTVTVTLAGDEQRLTKAFDNVGDAAERVDTRVREASDGMDRVSSAGDRASEAADTAETRFTGFYDTIGGTRDALAALGDENLSTTDKLVALGQAGADLAGGLVGFVIPAIQGMWGKLMATTAATAALGAVQTAWNAITAASTVAMGALNAVIRANPVLFLVGLLALLVGGFMVLWNRSEGFRNFFIGMWNGIKSVVGTVVQWVLDRWNAVISFFSGLPGRIGTAMGNLASIVKGVFKGAVNGVVDALNWFLDHSINWLIRKVNDVSGLIGIPAIPTIPHIPRMHSGGVVPGAPGSERLIMAQGGEEVVTRGQAGRGGTVTFAGDMDSALAVLIMKLFNTGQIRIT